MTKATRDVIDLDVRTVLKINFDSAATVKTGGTLWNQQVLTANSSGIINSLTYSQSATPNSILQRTGAGELTGIASSARYADLAERYEIDKPATIRGLLVSIGGLREITLTTHRCQRVLGVLSTNPGFKLNSDAGDDLTHPYVALVGRVPCQVTGPFKSGDPLVAAGCGMARAATWFERNFRPGRIFATALGRGVDSNGLVEVVIGR